MWTLRDLGRVNFFLQILHSYDFPPPCVCTWAVKCPDWVNFLRHTLHSKFFSPVWISECFFNMEAHLNVLWQTQHLLFFPFFARFLDFNLPLRLSLLLLESVSFSEMLLSDFLTLVLNLFEDSITSALRLSSFSVFSSALKMCLKWWPCRTMQDKLNPRFHSQ